MSDMFGELPPSSKVVGVSRRYIKFEERLRTLDTDAYRLTAEELDMGEYIRIAVVQAALTGLAITSLPLTRMRRKALQKAQEKEGLVPGEEDILTFAFNRLPASIQGEFPLVSREMLQR